MPKGVYKHVGKPRGPYANRKDAVTRLFDRRDIDANGCWLWNGVTVNGYGCIKYDGKNWKAHRLAYTYLVGPIPDGLDLDHVKAKGCKSRRCFNPEHLEPVTRSENLKRGEKHGSLNAKRGCCGRGHLWSSDNIYKRPNGDSVCLECQRMRKRASRKNELNRKLVLAGGA